MAITDLAGKIKSFFQSLNPFKDETTTVYAKRTGPGFDAPMQQPYSGRNKQSPQITASPLPSPTPTPMAQNVPAGGYGRNPGLSRYTISPDVHRALNQASTKYNVPVELLYDMAAQESSFNPHLVNTTPAGRVAGNPTGLYQFTDNTWSDVVNMYNNKPGMSLSLPNTNRTDPMTNAEAAAYLIKNGQLGKWDASEDVWGNYWTPDELEALGFYKQSMYHKPGVRPSARLKGKQ